MHQPTSHVPTLPASPVTALPVTDSRSTFRTVAANGAARPADDAAAAFYRVLRTAARGFVGAADLDPCNRNHNSAADAAVTCVTPTPAFAVTNVLTTHRQQRRRCTRAPLRCGNMCNGPLGFLELVRRIVCVEGTDPVPGAHCVMHGAARFRRATFSVTLDRDRQGVSRSRIAARSPRSIAATAPSP